MSARQKYIEQVQKHCCCHSSDARECYRSRHNARLNDEGGYDDDDYCECCCHGAIDEYDLDMEDASL